MAAAPPDDPDRASFLEELIVRRELAHNFVWYTGRTTTATTCLPRWAQAIARPAPPRPPPAPSTTRRELEAGPDPRPLLQRGHARDAAHRLHAQLHAHVLGQEDPGVRASPEEAYATALRLNNRHFLCGRGPNAFANVAWIFGQHDRPWVERPVFGQVRYMNDKGLERKFDIAAYVRWTERLEG